MPLFLLIVGIVFVTASVRGTHKLFFDTVKSDFTGPGNFFYWGMALWAIIAVGYFKPLRPLSNVFLTLVIVMMIFANRGFFDRFMEIMRGTEVSSGGALSPVDAAMKTVNDVINIVKG